MSSLIFAVALLLVAIANVDAIVVTSLSQSGLPYTCSGIQTAANISPNTGNTVVFGCPIGNLATLSSQIKVTFDGASPAANSCNPSYVGLVSGSAGAPTFSTVSGSVSGNSFTFRILSTNVVAGSVHEVKISTDVDGGTCTGLTADYVFYIQFLAAPTITGVTTSTSSYSTYCHKTGTGPYALDSCYNSGGGLVTITGTNLDRTLFLEGTDTEPEFNLLYYCRNIPQAISVTSPPTWNTGTGTINSATTIVLTVASLSGAASSSGVNSGTHVPYEAGKNCDLRTNSGSSSTAITFSWFTATTTLTSLTATSGICTSSGNNLINCLQFGSSGAQAITFVGTNFGPDDAPLVLTGANDLCTTTTLTRRAGLDEATCILKSNTALTVATPSLLAIGVSTTEGVSGPTATYGSTVINKVTGALTSCKASCDYNSDGTTDSLCGCPNVETGEAIGTITLQGSNFLPTGTFDACDGSYTSAAGLEATCTGQRGATNNTLPLRSTGRTFGLLAYKTNAFASRAVITSPVTWVSATGNDNYFDIIVKFTTRVSGRAWVHIVDPSYTPATVGQDEEEAKDGTILAANLRCSSGAVTVTGNLEKVVTLTNCKCSKDDIAIVYVDQDVTGLREVGTYYGTVDESTNAVVFPTIITRITSPQCTGQCTIGGTEYLCGCPLSGITLTMYSSFETTPTDSALCGSNTITTGTDGSETYYTCTLGSTGTVGGSFTSSNKGARNKVYFITNTFSAGPTISATAWQSGTDTYDVTVQFTAPITGRYTIAIISADANTAGDFTVANGYNLDYSANGGILCQSDPYSTPNAVTAATQVTKLISSCPSTVQKGFAKVYVEGVITGYTTGISGTVGTSGAISLPIVVTSITATAGCQATCSGHPCGCNTNGATAQIQVTASNLDENTPTDTGLCTGAITYTNGNGYYSCTLKGGSIGGSVSSSHSGLADNKKVEFWTNSFSSGPTLGTIAYTGNGATDLYSVVVQFTASVLPGKYAAALVAAADEAGWDYADTHSGAGTNCEVATLTTMSAAVTVTLTGCTMTSATTYKVHVYVEGASQTQATGVNAATATVTLPPVVSSITPAGGSVCSQCSSDSGKGTTNICGCPLAGGDTVTINGKNLNGKEENSLCSVATAISSDDQFTCTLATSSAAGTFKQVGFTSTTSYGTVRAFYITNQPTSLSLPVAPTSSAVGDYKTTFSVSFTAATAGKAWVVAYAGAGNSFEPTMANLKANTAGGTGGIQYCVATGSGTNAVTVGTNTFVFTCGDGTQGNAFAMTNGWNARVFVYAEGSGDAVGDYYGSLSSVLSFAVCHSDCGTCSRSELGYCETCGSTPTGVHKETYNGLNYCCLAECMTCGPKVSASSTLTADSCTACYFEESGSVKDHLSRNGGLPTYCCHGSCSTCNGNSDTQCLTCGGYNTGLFNSGTGKCNNGAIEIHGDPHFRGYLDQDYTITGRPGAYYSIITDPWLQYNTKFIWYGDVYHGFDPTTNKPYDANVTYIGEIGMKFNWGDHEDRVHIAVDDFAVRLNGYVVPKDTVGGVKFGIDCSIVQGKKFIDIETPKFRVRFFLAGSRKHPFINQRVELLQWPSIRSHGLLGQTWKMEQRQGIDRNQIWEGHQAGVDFQFRSTEFLEGRLIDYELHDGIFGDDFTYNLYHFGKN